MRLTLAKLVQQRLLKKKFVPPKTTFVTEGGPAIGTIWFDAELPKHSPLIVNEVNVDGNHILYESGYSDTITTFLKYVREGRYILIGVVPDTMCHTVT